MIAKNPFASFTLEEDSNLALSATRPLSSFGFYIILFLVIFVPLSSVSLFFQPPEPHCILPVSRRPHWSTEPIAADFSIYLSFIVSSVVRIETDKNVFVCSQIPEL